LKYDRAGGGSDDDDDDDDVGDSVSCVWAGVPVAIANAPSRGGRREPWTEAAARQRLRLAHCNAIALFFFRHYIQHAVAARLEARGLLVLLAPLAGSREAGQEAIEHGGLRVDSRTWDASGAPEAARERCGCQLAGAQSTKWQQAIIIMRREAKCPARGWAIAVR
jgi:hypothetical protein